MNRYYRIGDDYYKISKDEFGKPRRFIVLKTKEAKQFAGYTLINKDLELVNNALFELAKNKDSVILQQSLITFAIVTYAKCFTENKGGRGVTLNESEIFKGDEYKSLMKMHQEIMNLRNDYVAHAGSEFERCRVTGTFVFIGKDFLAGVNVESHLEFMINMPPKLNEFEQLYTFVKEKVNQKSKKVLSKIQSTIQGNPQEAYNQSILPNLNNIYKMVTVEKSKETALIEYVSILPHEF
jgi:hypothetical protein